MTFIAPQAKLFGHLDRLHELRTGTHTRAPVNVEIDLSNRCSLGCEWCHFGFTHTRGPLTGKREKPPDAVPGGDLMDTALAYSIVEQLAAAGVRSITWTGGGEPTLHPAFDEIIRRTTATGMEQGLYTHGGHIKPERAALLKQALTYVYVSLDAVDGESYSRWKGVPGKRFDNACEGLRLLACAEGEATVGLGYLITEENWCDAGRAADLALELGADYVQFRPTILYTQAEPGEPAENTAWIDEALPALELLAAEPHVELDTDRFRLYRDWQGHGYPTCWWSLLQTVITPNGKLWICVNKREHPAAEIGDLSVESFADIWGRHRAAAVTHDCRVMCRGHLANLALAEITAEHPHPAFI